MQFKENHEFGSLDTLEAKDVFALSILFTNFSDSNESRGGNFSFLGGGIHKACSIF